MPTPKISIVVATYGRAAHLNKLFESVRSAFPEGTYEIIAVSSDPVGEKREWMERQPDVKTIIYAIRQAGQPRYASLYKFENIGIKAATGEWIVVTNDDTEFDPMFYWRFISTANPPYQPLSESYDVVMVKGHLGDVGLGCRTAVIGTITPPSGQVRPLYLYDFTIIRKSVYEKIGYLDENLDWFGKGFDLAMACETQPGLRICYESEMKINHSIAAEERKPPHYARDFQYATTKWENWCSLIGWDFTWPW